MTSCSLQHAEELLNNAALARNLGKLANDPLDQAQYLKYPANKPPVGALAVVRVPMLGKTDGSFTLLLAEYNALGFRCPRMWSAIRGVIAYRILPESWIVK